MRTREDVAASMNVANRRFAELASADAARLVARGESATYAEALERVSSPDWLRGSVTAEQVDEHCTRLWEALQRTWQSFQALSPSWPEDVRARHMAHMTERQEWLIAAREHFGELLDAAAVERAEQELERDMEARRRAA